jgi:hypothetical protein
MTLIGRENGRLVVTATGRPVLNAVLRRILGA